MGTKTIEVREDTYERLKARKQEDESFTELVERLLEEVKVDWRDGFGTLEAEEMEELRHVIEQLRQLERRGLAHRQQEAFESFTQSDENSDETA